VDENPYDPPKVETETSEAVQRANLLRDVVGVTFVVLASLAFLATVIGLAVWREAWVK